MFFFYAQATRLAFQEYSTTRWLHSLEGDRHQSSVWLGIVWPFLRRCHLRFFSQAGLLFLSHKLPTVLQRGWHKMKQCDHAWWLTSMSLMTIPPLWTWAISWNKNDQNHMHKYRREINVSYCAKWTLQPGSGNYWERGKASSTTNVAHPSWCPKARMKIWILEDDNTFSVTRDQSAECEWG